MSTTDPATSSADAEPSEDFSGLRHAAYSLASRLKEFAERGPALPKTNEYLRHTSGEIRGAIRRIDPYLGESDDGVCGSESGEPTVTLHANVPVEVELNKTEEVYYVTAGPAPGLSQTLLGHIWVKKEEVAPDGKVWVVDPASSTKPGPPHCLSLKQAVEELVDYTLEVSVRIAFELDELEPDAVENVNWHEE